LRIALFNLLPLVIELAMVMIIIMILYPIIFFIVTASSVLIYVLATVYITEWRAKYFKSAATKDTEYV
jgi:ATP-binding cassette subfamily B protein